MPALQTVLLVAWAAGNAATFVWLTFFEGYVYTAWNWIVAVPVNFILAAMWPIYWAVLRPLMG